MAISTNRQLIAEAFRFHIAGRLDQATRIYLQVLSSEPDNFDALSLAGGAALQAGDNNGAEELLQQAITRGKQSGPSKERRERLCDTYANLATALQNQRKLDVALTAARAALNYRPGDAGLLANTGYLLKQLGRLDEAEVLLRRALAIDDRQAATWARLAQVLMLTKRRAQAVQAVDAALKRESRSAAYIVLKGMLLIEEGKIGDALDAFNAALRIDPNCDDAIYNRSVLLVTQGRFAEGWQGYYRHHPRWRSVIKNVPMLPRRLDGLHVYVSRNQGLGDELFFLRFVPMLKSRGAQVSHLSDPRLASLVSRAGCIDRVLVDETAAVSADYRTPVDLLPYFLEAGDSDIPASLRLTAREDSVRRMAVRLSQAGPPPYVGITWRAGSQPNEIDYRNVVTGVLVKEIAPTILGNILRNWPGTTLVLQRKPGSDEVGEFNRALEKNAADFSDVNNDLEDMLALLSLIERYVAVSNTNVHLRAAAGLPSHVLVPNPPELRWGFSDRSPWFPDCPVYRQTPDGNWQHAVDHLLADLIC